MLGAEACLWGEHTNEAVMNVRVWPRAAVRASKQTASHALPFSTESMFVVQQVLGKILILNAMRARALHKQGMAEALWSGYEGGNVTEAYPRLLRHRCRMVQRGVPVAPLQPGFC